MNEKKLYVLVRKDHSKSKQAVQAGHAVAEYLLTNPRTEWKNGTLIYLQVPDEQTLKEWHSKLKDEASDLVWFTEPDIGDQVTALACSGEPDKFEGMRLL